jgi:glutamyl-tRNA reductase
MTGALINKILHDPTIFLKNNGMVEDKSLYIDIIRRLFKLDG